MHLARFRQFQTQEQPLKCSTLGEGDAYSKSYKNHFNTKSWDSAL